MLTLARDSSHTEWACTAERPGGQSYLFFEEFRLQVKGAKLQHVSAEVWSLILTKNHWFCRWLWSLVVLKNKISSLVLALAWRSLSHTHHSRSHTPYCMIGRMLFYFCLASSHMGFNLMIRCYILNAINAASFPFSEALVYPFADRLLYPVWVSLGILLIYGHISCDLPLGVSLSIAFEQNQKYKTSQHAILLIHGWCSGGWAQCLVLSTMYTASLMIQMWWCVLAEGGWSTTGQFWVCDLRGQELRLV